MENSLSLPPKITVVIPTRERSDVLRKSLQTVLAQRYGNMEVLISDNCSADDTAKVVQSFDDSRVRYVNTGRRVSMSHNWEFALSHIEDGWVMIMGDDDGLLPGALERVAALIKETGTTAIISNFVTYIWPNDQNRHCGRLLVPTARGYEVRKSSEWLRRVLRGQAWYSELPMMYAGGVMRMDLIRSVRDRKGSFFQSCQPDIFSAIALASVTDTYVYSHEPFAIAGHSRHSNGSSWSASGREAAAPEKLEPVKKFLSEDNIPFHQDIPLNADGSFPVSIDLLVYESYLQARYLHHNKLGVKHEDQLRLFVSRKIDDAKRMREWTSLFARQHGLDAEAARSRGTALALLVSRTRELTHAFLTYYRIEPSFGIRMRDVYEASIVAQTVLRLRPPKAKSYVNTLRKWSTRAMKLRLSVR